MIICYLKRTQQMTASEEDNLKSKNEHHHKKDKPNPPKRKKAPKCKRSNNRLPFSTTRLIPAGTGYDDID